MMMEWLNLFLWMINWAMQLTVGYFFQQSVCCCLELRSKSRPFFAVSVAAYAIVSSVVVFPNDPFNINLMVLTFLIANFILCRGSVLIRVAVTLVLFPIAVTVQFFHIDVGGKIFFQFYTEADGLENQLIATATYLLVVLFWYLFHRFLRDDLVKMREQFNRAAWLQLIVISLASFTAIFSSVYFAPEESWKIWPCVLACGITSIGTIKLSANLAEGIYAEREAGNLRLQQSYYKELEQNQAQIRKLRHDMNSQLAVIGQLMESGQLEEAAEHFRKLDLYTQAGTRKFCENSIVNALLCAKYSVMEESGIDSFFNISIDGMIPIDDVSLCTIFANTLDNAIEACQKIQPPMHRHISVKARYTDSGYFSYEIENSKVNSVRETGGRLHTDKSDPWLHGIGVTSVKSIVNRYGGTMDISYTEDTFRVTILIG